MTREIIEDFRKIIIPFTKDRLLNLNYEGLGKSDAEEYEKHSNEILDMALQTLNQQSCGDAVSKQKLKEQMSGSEKPNNSKPAAENTADKEEKDHKSITDLLDDAKTKMCNEYCRYPFMPIPEGKDDDWLAMDPDSPCANCPLDML